MASEGQIRAVAAALERNGITCIVVNSADEAREAVRALRGSTLRQEVYGLDGTARADIPYTVAESNFTIRPLQPLGHNRYAVFFTHPRETITFHYERDPDDQGP